MELFIIPVQYSIIFASQGWWVVCTKITGSQRRSNSIVDKKNDKKKKFIPLIPLFEAKKSTT